MEEIIQHMELEIRKLADRKKQLEQANAQLYSTTDRLSQEKQLLLQKQQQAIGQIQSLVSKLKAIEK